MELIIRNGDNDSCFDLSADRLEQLEWALIKGADCGMDFCMDILEVVSIRGRIV